MSKSDERLKNYTFMSIYAMYVQKAERKNRTIDELDTVLAWLTGYEPSQISQVEPEITLQQFFDSVPALNPNADLIKGVICGVRVEELTDRTVQLVRYMDKIVDELAKGKALEKIMRTP